jgi:HAD superfamily hydrolase (TIGR01509 family)
MTLPSLVVFDCDGVLVDSEPIALRLLVDAAAEAGAAVDAAEAQTRWLGRSFATAVADLRERHGVAFDATAQDRLRAALYAAFRRDLRAISGIAETLDALDRPFCVASSSDPERIRVSLDIVGLLDRFEHRIFSAAMVSRGKPAPDLFLLAAERMGVAPHRCAVVEDSPAGIRAARAAGMRALAFTGGGHAGAAGHRAALVEAGADALFDDMRALPALLDGSRTTPRAQGGS